MAGNPTPNANPNPKDYSAIEVEWQANRTALFSKVKAAKDEGDMDAKWRAEVTSN